MMYDSITIRSLILAMLFAGMGSVRAADLDREQALQLNNANRLLREGDIDGAIAAYQQMEQLGVPSDDLRYNGAVAHYRKGDVADAALQFRSLAAADDDSIAAKARFNLGNCEYVAALQQAEQNRVGAIEQLTSAIQHYRNALQINPLDPDARANIELATQLIDKLRREQEQQQSEQQQSEQQQSEQQQSEQQQSEQQQSEQQQSEQQQSEQQQSEQQQSEQQQSEQQQSEQQQSEQQQSEQQQSEQQQSEQQQSEQQQSEQQQSEQQQSEQQQSEQQQSEQQQSEQQQSDQQQSQQQQSEQQQAERQNTGQDEASQRENAGGESDNSPSSLGDGRRDESTPSKNMPQDNQQSKETPPSSNHTHGEEPDAQGKEPPQGSLSSLSDGKSNETSDRQGAAMNGTPEGEMTAEEAAKMLQSIRDRDMLRRLRQQAAERSQYVPVERDW